MSVEILPHERIDYEPIPVLSYEEYRGLCDGMQPNVYRKTGIDSLEGYTAASEDEKTIYVELNGRRLPLFVPLEYAGGYDVDRTKRLADAESIYALALPPGFTEEMDIDLETHMQELGGKTAVIVETAAEDTQAMKDVYTQRLGGAGWRVQDFLDERLEGMSDEQRMARISLYVAHFEAHDDEGNLIPYKSKTLSELYQEEVEEVGSDDTEVINPRRIAMDKELFGELWEPHDVKFDWLGEYHPVSMQENKKFYEELVTDNQTGSIVRFATDEDGGREPVCHGILLEDGMKRVGWINDRYKEAMEEEAAKNGERIVFYYGIASKSSAEDMAHYAKEVMSLNSRLAKRNGGKVMLILESTTMSSLYIPRLVGDYSRAEPKGMVITEDIKPISQVDYWCLTSSGVR